MLRLLEPSSDHVRAYLATQPLKYALHLKMLRHFSDGVRLRRVSSTHGEGVLLRFSIGALHYDRESYPDCDGVLMPVADDPSLLPTLLEGLPTERHVFKLTEDRDVQCLVANYAIRPIATFENFTHPAQPARPQQARVEVSTTPSDWHLAAFAENAYSAAEIDHFLHARGQIFTSTANGAPVATAIVFPLFGDIFEIGGVYTEMRHRHRGYARDVVSGALRWIHESEKVARLVVKRSNGGSLALARALQMAHVVTVTHCVAR
jgi:hypothetical protein